jgi:hypothetical protein
MLPGLFENNLMHEQNPHERFTPTLVRHPAFRKTTSCKARL